MKRIILLISIALACNCASAQETQQVEKKNFFSDMKCDITFGIRVGRVEGEVTDEIHYIEGYSNYYNIMGLSLGVDVKKPILHFPNEASTIYAATGLHFLGNKVYDDEFLVEGDLIRHIKIPLYAGFSYQFKKCSLFIELGPCLMFNIGGDHKEEYSSTAYGLGTHIGIKFRRFSFSVGTEKGLTKFTKDGMKANPGCINLSWTLGHKK